MDSTLTALKTVVFALRVQVLNVMARKWLNDGCFAFSSHCLNLLKSRIARLWSLCLNFLYLGYARVDCPMIAVETAMHVVQVLCVLTGKVLLIFPFPFCFFISLY